MGLTVEALKLVRVPEPEGTRQIDYLDVYNGGSYADGTFEESDPRLFLSTGWDAYSEPVASGGGYMREDDSTACSPLPVTASPTRPWPTAAAAGPTSISMACSRRGSISTAWRRSPAPSHSAAWEPVPT